MPELPDISELLVPEREGQHGPRPPVCLRADLLDNLLHGKRGAILDSEGVVTADTKRVERNSVGDVLFEERAPELSDEADRA